MAESGAAAACLGPIPQSHFLLGLGIEARLQQLLATATPQQAEALQAGFRWARGVPTLAGAVGLGVDACLYMCAALVHRAHRLPNMALQTLVPLLLLLLQAVGGRQRAGGGAA